LDKENKMTARILTTTLLPLAALAFAVAAPAQNLTGLWDASITLNGHEIPFRMEFSGHPPAVSGSFFNGDEKITSTSGSLDKGDLLLTFDYYGAKLQATLKDGVLTGAYVRGARSLPFHARPFVPPTAGTAQVPSIAGLWEIASKTSKGEQQTWKFVVRQSGPEVSAAILRVDGDTGSLSGSYRDGKFVLSHFSGARPSLFEITPNQDGTLSVVQNGGNLLTAVRPADARAKGLPEPPDPSRYTSVKDPSEPLHFRFPDLNGKIVSDADPRFRGKVVIVSIGGSWCPNCHDEAPFLEELYKKFHARGLEIVELSFEDADEMKDLDRVKAFIKRYGIEYPVLLPGAPAELQAKIPQAVNLRAFPTTFFLGRDGKVRAVHAGFASPATGDLHRDLVEETTRLVERLLAETAISSR
jgi:thiol-disulfide isomerase/thioredoxin